MPRIVFLKNTSSCLMPHNKRGAAVTKGMFVVKKLKTFIKYIFLRASIPFFLTATVFHAQDWQQVFWKIIFQLLYIADLIQSAHRRELNS